MTDDAFQLQSSRATATIELLAGRLASLVIDGMEILVTEGAKPSRHGSFPMVPWCGRLAHGRLEFQGQTHDFPITSPPHANHGTAMFQTWARVGDDEIEVALDDPWPFGGSVRQRFALTEDALTVHMIVTAGDRPMPAQIGWHPWYRRQLDRGGPLELEFAAGLIHATDDDMIPTGELVAVPPEPWNETFVDVTQQPVLRWGDELRLNLSSDLDHWVVFTEPEHAVAIEPQSGAPNDLNRAPHVLAPDESLSGWMRLEWA